MKDNPKDNIGELYTNTITEKISLILNGKEGKYPNTEEYTLLQDDEIKNITIARDRKNKRPRS